MDKMQSRREFLKLTLASSAGLGVLPLAGRLPGTRSAGILEAAGDLPPDLPPRVIGLRTTGGNFRFDPVGIRVDPGEDVIWLNMGDFHTASAFHPENSELLGGDVSPRIPEGAASFHSGMLGMSSGTEFSYRATVEGVYDYFCQPHYSFGMVGRFIVGEARDGPAVTRPLSELNEPSREEMPAVEAILGLPGRGFEWSARVNGLLFQRVHDRSAPAAAEAVREGVEADERLRRLLDGAGGISAFRQKLDTFLEAFRNAADYEGLLGLADEAKAPLRAAIRAAR